MFLMTNSGFEFVNAGMRHLLGEDWRSFFDLVIVDANKPNWCEHTHTGTTRTRVVHERGVAEGNQLLDDDGTAAAAAAAATAATAAGACVQAGRSIDAHLAYHSRE